jgi:NTP pyrophosphatase (non-canonical NTP hydrolase)/cell wall-associated NlpC family hydrolase
MNLGELQGELRHFAAERDWQPFHTPKNLATALMVEAAELAEIFQWMTPEASAAAHEDAESKGRIGAEVADVLLYLLQVADHCQIDLAHAVRDKLARNAEKYPAKHVIARVSPARASVPGTHVLLDYENVQPTQERVRALVPDARQLWVFHGPHQRDVEQRFASFGIDATAVPISKTGKNALDFHLSFYMGYIASKNPGSAMVVIANDKGYEPMLEHARAMGFAVRRLAHGEAKPAAKKAAAKKVAAKKAPATKAAAKNAAAKSPAAKQPAAKKAAAKKTAAVPAAKKTAAKKTATSAKAPTPPAKKAVANVGAAPAVAAGSPAPAVAKPVSSVPGLAATIKRLADNLRKMGDKRPTKPASLWRSLKSFLGKEATDEAVEAALAQLIADGVVKVDSAKGASYPTFAAESGSAVAKA